jgi:hypothetical protein
MLFRTDAVSELVLVLAYVFIVPSLQSDFDLLILPSLQSDLDLLIVPSLQSDLDLLMQCDIVDTLS